MRFLKVLGRWLSQHANLAIALATTAIGLGLFAYSGIGESRRAGFVFLQDIEQRSLDLRFAIRGKRAPDPRIAIVGIDEKTLREIGSYPLPRNSFVPLVRKLKENGARVVAFDMTFPTPQSSEALAVLTRLRQEAEIKASSGLEKKVEAFQQQADVDAQFAAALKDAGNVVLGHIFLGADRAASSDPKLAEAYFNIVWAKAFPQVLAAKSGKQNFEMGKAWVDAGGTVAQGVEANLPQFAEAAASYGFLNINADADGTLRRALFMIRYQNQDFFPSLALQILRQYEDIPDQQIAAYISANGLERIQFGSHQIHPWQNGTALINYVGPYHSYPHYSMSDVLQGALPAERFRDKIVIVGATALGAGDLRNTPFQKQDSGYMGVEVHANILDNLLHSNEPRRTFLIRGFREELVDIGFIVFFGAGLGFWFGRCRPLIATGTAVIVLGLFFAFVYFGFVHWGRWFTVVIPAATLVCSYVSTTSFRVVLEEREKRKIRKTFSQYLSPGVIALIEKDPQKYIRPGGEVKDLTVMFSDIRDFTNLSESMSPDELVRLLNEYLGAMTDILFRHLGTLDKYIGDAVMAFWGSPYPLEDHAYHACCCATEMIARLAELNRELERPWPPRNLDRHRPEYRTGQRRQHGIGQAPGLDGDGRQCQPGLPPGGHDETVPDPDHHQRKHLCPSLTAVCGARGGQDPGQRKETSRDHLRTAGSGVANAASMKRFSRRTTRRWSATAAATGEKQQENSARFWLPILMTAQPRSYCNAVWSSWRNLPLPTGTASM